MNEVVLALGLSHTPLLAVGPEHWQALAERDRKNPQLYDDSGALVSYDELLARHGGVDRPIPYEDLQSMSAEAEGALDEMARQLVAVAPDVVLIVGDDQEELFDSTNQPMLSIYHGAQIDMGRLHDEDEIRYWEELKDRYGMSGGTTFPGSPEFARGLISALVQEDVDIAASDATPAGRGFGHAFGFVARRLFGDREIPMVPILMNTYFPPNQPTPGRAYRIGQALRRAIDRCPGSLRIALVASGGLSHFIVNEELDQRVLKALSTDDEGELSRLPVQQLKAGSSEILNWILVGGAMRGRAMAKPTYVRAVRTSAGTGIGMAFAVWE